MMFAISAYYAASACVDLDGDGYGDYADSSCTFKDKDDCDETDSSINPGAAEVCNDNRDNDCNGYIDELATCTSIVCGNRRCDSPSETAQGCPNDCDGSSAPASEGDSCGDGACDSTEDGISCPQDCAMADFTMCNITSADWYKNGAILNYSKEGETVDLVVAVENIGEGQLSECDGMPIRFNVYEIDSGWPDGFTLVTDGTFKAGIASGMAKIGWPVIYAAEDVASDYFQTANPEYYLEGVYAFNAKDYLSVSEKLFNVFAADYNPTPQQQAGAQIDPGLATQSDVSSTCGDSICDSGEDVSCPSDCLQAQPVQAGPCTFNSVSWRDAEGSAFDSIAEGSPMEFIADASGCEGASIRFVVAEYDDGEEAAEEDFLADQIVEATVTGGKVVAGWAAYYADDEPDAATGDANPEYVLYALDPDDNPFASSNFFIVYREGEQALEVADTALQAQPELTPDLIRSSGIGAGQYQAGAEDFGALEQTQSAGGAPSGCGDGLCAEDEDYGTCPDDCAEKGSLKLIIIIIFLALLAGGVAGFFLWRRKNKSGLIKDEGPNGPVQQPAQPMQVQPQQPMHQQPQAKSPFANEGQLKATVDFIRTARSQGLADDKIKAMLKEGNYNQQQIDYAFANVK